MKKQILILVLAVLGSFSIATAQTLKNGDGNLSADPTFCPTPTPITATCIQAAGPLNPTPGLEYTYEVEVTPTIAAPGYIHWFVTTNPAFITGGVLNTAAIEDEATSAYIVAAGAAYNDITNISETVNITWEGMPATGNLFLVTFVKDAAGCTDNIKVYDIKIQHTFTLDMAYMTPGGATTSLDADCVAPVFGANYNAALVPPAVEMDYGVNHIFFVVNAASFSHSWMPKFELDIASGTTASTILAVDWAYPSESYTGAPTVDWHATTASGIVYTSTDPVLPQTTGASGVDAAGECIIVRVTIDHNQNEALANIPLNFAVNGIMYDQVNSDYLNPLLADISPVDGPGGECPYQVDFEDVLPYTLTPRPIVVDQVDPDPDNNFIGTNAD